jgi:hypothetical protein
MLSLVVSCVLFGHSLSKWSAVGACVVFVTLGKRVRRSYRRSVATARAAEAELLPLAPSPQ